MRIFVFERQDIGVSCLSLWNCHSDRSQGNGISIAMFVVKRARHGLVTAGACESTGHCFTKEIRDKSEAAFRIEAGTRSEFQGQDNSRATLLLGCTYTLTKHWVGVDPKLLKS